jgi:hypothetical protein
MMTPAQREAIRALEWLRTAAMQGEVSLGHAANVADCYRAIRRILPPEQRTGKAA